MGVGGAMMWPAILGMTYAALPEGQGGHRRRADPRLGRCRPGDRAADRRHPHRVHQLAGRPVREPADRGIRHGRRLAEDPPAADARRGRADRLCRHGHPHARGLRAAVRARPGDGLGLGRLADHRLLRRLRRAADRRVRPHRAADGPERAAPRRPGPQPWLHLGVGLRRAAVGPLLLLDALPASVHAEGARLLARQGGPRDAAAVRAVRRAGVRGRPALQPGRREADGVARRARLGHRRRVAVLPERRRRLPRDRAGDDRARRGDRAVLPVGDDGRRDGGQGRPAEPRRRRGLHVPDRRRRRSASGSRRPSSRRPRTARWRTGSRRPACA